MERLGLVALPAGRDWRTYAGPVGFLLAVTIAVALLRGQLTGSSHPAAAAHAVTHAHARVHVSKAKRVYVVKAGDTLAAIAGRTGVSLNRLIALNPKVSPTALFIGEKLNLQ
jgi:LysM repeat protein